MTDIGADGGEALYCLMVQLAAAGIDLASVTDVVLTHMHMDYIGGLLVDEMRSRLRPDLPRVKL